MYFSVYNHLSAESHNDARVLISRHLIEDQPGHVSLTLYRPDAPYVVSSLVEIRHILDGMSTKVAERFQITNIDRSAVDKTYAALEKVLAPPPMRA